MSKLFELRQWFTISEAAAQLAECFNEKVSVKDVFQLVLDKHLKLAVSFLKEMPAHRTNIQPFCKSKLAERQNKLLGIQPNIDLNDVIWLPCGEWDLPMIESNYSYIRQLNADLPFLELQSTTNPLIVEDSTGEQFCLLGENFPFESPPGYSMPKGNILVVRTKVLNAFIDSVQTTGSPTSSASTVNLDDAPKELRQAISVYYEFWHEKPEETNPAQIEDIKIFLHKEAGEDISEESIKRITTIAKPEKARKGGAPKSEWKDYKGKTQEK